MKDLIDRQVAIDDLRGKDPSQVWDTADIEVWINSLPSAQGFADTAYLEKMSEYTFDTAFEMGKASAQRWIPVSKRLPEYGEKVIVTKKVEGRPDTVDISYCYVQKEGFWSDTGFAAKVVAWMPIEPWKGEREEDGET